MLDIQSYGQRPVCLYMQILSKIVSWKKKSLEQNAYNDTKVILLKYD